MMFFTFFFKFLFKFLKKISFCCRHGTLSTFFPFNIRIKKILHPIQLNVFSSPFSMEF